MTDDSMPSFPPDDEYSNAATAARHEWAAKISGADLGALEPGGEGDLYRGNIENLFAFIRLPVGLAGPLKLRGQHAEGEFLVPMATTEGTLVASFNRGMKAIRESGGAETAVLQNEIYSTATFVTQGPKPVAELAAWFERNQGAIAEAVAKETSHGSFLRSEQIPFGTRLIVNFVYDPADAMGINMITSATHGVCTMVAAQHGGLEFYLPSALQGDKKTTAYGFHRGRGRSASAQIQLRGDVIASLLHSSAEAMLRYHRNNIDAAQLSGGHGFNMQIANGITALGLATGQDVAYVAESANGQLVIEPMGDDLLFSLTIPSLYVGTVGGGTGLPTHRPLLEMMGCVGPGSALKLAEIFAATCLAGEISVLAAIASNQFVQAHDKLGRNRPGEG